VVLAIGARFVCETGRNFVEVGKMYLPGLPEVVWESRDVIERFPSRI